MPETTCQTPTEPACHGCRRMATDRNTLRFWASHDDSASEEGDYKTGSYRHVDPSGVAYDCTFVEPDFTETVKAIHQRCMEKENVCWYGWCYHWGSVREE